MCVHRLICVHLRIIVSTYIHLYVHWTWVQTGVSNSSVVAYGSFKPFSPSSSSIRVSMFSVSRYWYSGFRIVSPNIQTALSSLAQRLCTMPFVLNNLHSIPEFFRKAPRPTLSSEPMPYIGNAVRLFHHMRQFKTKYKATYLLTRLTSLRIQTLVHHEWTTYQHTVRSPYVLDHVF